MPRPFRGSSVTRAILLVVGAALVVMQVSATSYDSLAKWREIKVLAEQRANAALDMLEAVHTQAMLNRVHVEDGDPSVTTLDGTLRQFSESSEGIKLWLSMSPQLVNHQRTAAREVEPSRDALDAAAMATAQTQKSRVGSWLRIARPVILGEGHAKHERCLGCHAGLTGARKGDVVGTYSTAVDLAPAMAFWRANTLHQVLAGLGTTLIILGVTASLLLMTTLRPLRNLTAATRRLAAGRLDIAVEHTQRRDELGTLARSLEIFRTRLLEKRHSEDKLAHMARHDLLTGLPNRASLNDYLGRALEGTQRSGRKVAAIAIDIERLSEINDVYGHATGDKVLKALSHCMAGLTQEGELVARIGGDEFAAVKQFDEQPALLDFVARLEACIATTLTIDGSDIRTAADLGVAVYPDDAACADELMTKAAIAMQRARANGGRAICFYEMSLDEAARRRSRLIEDLWGAIARNELSLAYQIQKSIRTSATVGFEALLRWRHADFGMVPPDIFIPLAEDCGAIVPIGEWVLRTACAEAARWPSPHRIAVNISARQLAHEDLPERIHDILMETGLAPARLELEITESAIIGDKRQALATLRRFEEMGVHIALDDFGTGYSSLDTLRSFPFGKIKIDRSFVSELATSAQAHAILRALIALGHSLGVQVLAEGVETGEQLALLEAEQCDEAQGYLFGRPQAEVAMGDGGARRAS
jgi:diguanylate cyclase (GGDEF)-like protein